jgi:hypothetical protein
MRILPSVCQLLDLILYAATAIFILRIQAPVTHTYNPSYWEAEIRGSWFKASPKFSRPYLENTQHNKGLLVWLKW